MDSKPTRLFLIRHAETEWNTARIFQGHLDSTLTPRGLQQATELAARIAPEGLSAVYSSDLGRSMRTAEPVATRAGLTVIPTSDLREIDCGEWTGKPYQDVRTLWPDHFANWRHHPERHQMPGGESLTQVMQRCTRFLQTVRDHHAGQTVCGVTHNAVVRAALCYLQGWSLSRIWEGERQPNCAINLIEFTEDEITLVEIGNAGYLSNVDTVSVTAII